MSLLGWVTNLSPETIFEICFESFKILGFRLAEGEGLMNIEVELLQGVCASTKEKPNRLSACWFHVMLLWRLIACWYLCVMPST